MDWKVTWDMHDELCGTVEEPTCMLSYCSNPPAAGGFAFYDVEISAHQTNPLALAVGGNGSECGLILVSTNHGLDWNSERHECCVQGLDCTGCDSDPDYQNNGGVGETWKLRRLHELYSVSIFDADNTAIAAGYGGQHLRRGTTGVWHDESEYSNDFVDAPNGISTPMYGTSADEGGLGTGKGLISGVGGIIRRTPDGGDSWDTEVPGDPWRIRDVYFVSQTVGFSVGQRYRIGKTFSGGTSWEFATPHPTGGQNLLAITFDGTNEHGVTVGESPNAGTPRVMFTSGTPIGASWNQASLIDIPGTNSTEKALRDVDWAGGLHFWTAGQSGLIYHSTNGGSSWDQFVPSGLTWTQLARFDIEGVAFRDTQTGIFVGSKNGEAAAYLYLYNSGTVTWTHIPSPEIAGLLAFHDVELDVANDKAYVVATRLDAEEDEFGVLFVKVGIASTSSAFVATGVEVEACDVGDDLADTPTLNELELAPGGALWIGGECGRVYRYTGGDSATEFKSQTDAHVRGISFPAAGSGNLGYFGCFRIGRAGWSIVKYAPGS